MRRAPSCSTSAGDHSSQLRHMRLGLAHGAWSVLVRAFELVRFSRLLRHTARSMTATHWLRHVYCVRQAASTVSAQPVRLSVLPRHTACSILASPVLSRSAGTLYNSDVRSSGLNGSVRTVRLSWLSDVRRHAACSMAATHWLRHATICMCNATIAS